MFVCSGNICRSPLAAVMADQKFDAKDIPKRIISSGTLNINGQPAAQNSQRIATEYNLDLSQHRSQGISKGFVQACDYIVCMSPKHAAHVLKLSQSANVVVRLWEYVKLDDIHDPVGKDVEEFRKCGAIINEALDAWIETISSNS